VTTARAEYLFALAHICHTPPAAVTGLTIADFGRLTLGIDALNDPDGD
jgi:hypothetical protein